MMSFMVRNYKDRMIEEFLDIVRTEYPMHYHNTDEAVKKYLAMDKTYLEEHFEQLPIRLRTMVAVFIRDGILHKSGLNFARNAIPVEKNWYEDQLKIMSAQCDEDMNAEIISESLWDLINMIHESSLHRDDD